MMTTPMVTCLISSTAFGLDVGHHGRPPAHSSESSLDLHDGPRVRDGHHNERDEESQEELDSKEELAILLVQAEFRVLGHSESIL
jgi:hypothetical protein